MRLRVPRSRPSVGASMAEAGAVVMGFPSGSVSSQRLASTDLVDQGRQDHVGVAHHAEVGDLEDGGLGVLVDRDDGPRSLHARRGAGSRRRCRSPGTAAGRRSCRSARPGSRVRTSPGRWRRGTQRRHRPARRPAARAARTPRPSPCHGRRRSTTAASVRSGRPVLAVGAPVGHPGSRGRRRRSSTVTRSTAGSTGEASAGDAVRPHRDDRGAPHHLALRRSRSRRTPTGSPAGRPAPGVTSDRVGDDAGVEPDGGPGRHLRALPARGDQHGRRARYAARRATSASALGATR